MKGGHLNEPGLLAKLEIAIMIVCKTVCFCLCLNVFKSLDGNIFRSMNERMSWKLLFNPLEKILLVQNMWCTNSIVAQSMVIRFNRLVV